MKSKIELLGKNKLQDLFDKSKSYSEILKSIGLCPSGGSSRKTIKKYEILWNIKKDKFEKNYLDFKKDHIEKLKKINKKSKIDLEKILTKNSLFNIKNIKRRIIEENLLEYKCKICENIGQWMGRKLCLQIDHINGVSNDNRIENIRFLCPNCHSQTDTWGSKNRKQE